MTNKLLSYLIVVLVVTITGSILLSEKLLWDEVLDDVAEDTATNSQEVAELVKQHYAEYRQDIHFLHQSLLVNNFDKIEQQSNGYQQNLPHNDLSKITQIFQAFLVNHPNYFQLRVLDLNADEKIRVERLNGQVVITETKRLQNKRHRDYFTEAQLLQFGEMYISRVTLNEEFGSVEIPYRPTIRIALNIYKNETKLGLLIANIDFTSILEAVNATLRNPLIAIIGETNNDVISYPRQRVLFANQLHHENTFSSTFSFEPSDDNSELVEVEDHFNSQNRLLGQVFQMINSKHSKFDVLIAVPFAYAESMMLSGRLKVYSGLGLILVIIASVVFLLYRNIRFHQRLAESRTESQAIIDNINDAIMLVDEHNHLLSMNPAAQRLFNESQTRIQHIDFESIFNLYSSLPLQTLKRMFEKQDSLLNTEITWSMNQEQTYFECSIMPVFLSADKTHFVVILSDISVAKEYALQLGDVNKQLEAAVTERTKELEAALAEVRKANSLKTQFISAISHEMRTPLNGILGAVSVLKRHHSDKGIDNIVEMAEVSTNSLSMLVNDILDLSKIEAGKLDINSSWFDPEKLVESIAQTASIQAFNKHLTVNVDTSGLELTAFKSDPFRTTQILNNLLNNAIKFTEHGSISLIVSSELPADEGQAKLKFTIKDTGIGIREDVQPRLFSVFSQGSKEVAAKYGGSGLGLAICKQLVELLGGKISLQSRPEEGTAVSFYLTSDEFKLRNEPRAARLTGQNIGLLMFEKEEATHLATLLTALGASTSLLKIDDKARQSPDITNVIVNLDSENAENLVHEWLNHQSDDWLSHTHFMGASCAGYDYCFKQIKLNPVRKPIGLSVLLAELANERKSTGILIDTPTRRSSDIKQEETEKTQTFNNEVILVVDDNEINRDVVGYMLEQANLRLVFAEDGVQALEVLKKQQQSGEPVDLILMDCNMPVLNGYDATSRIRDGKIGDELKDTPIIALTANAMKGERERCEEAGMNDYITKPVDADNLIHKLSMFLGKREARDSEQALEALPIAQLDIWNKEEALQRLAGNEELLKRIISMLLSSMEERVDSIKQAIEQGDENAIHQFSHKLKGAVGEVGAMRLHADLGKLEGETNKDTIQLLFKQIETECDELKPVLSEYIAA